MRALRRSAVIGVTIMLLQISATAIADPSAASSPTLSPPVDPIAGHVAEATRRFGIPEDWIWAVMRVESGGDPRAISSAGAMGLMQIMPATWATLCVRYGLGEDVYDPRANIMAGAAYLREMHDRYGSPTAMLAAYNAGPGRYDDFLSRGRPLPAETVAYLTKLVPMLGGRTASRSVVITQPDPLAWTRSALFTVRTGDPAAAQDDAGDRQSPVPTAAPPTTPITTAETPRETLFVAISSQPPR